MKSKKVTVTRPQPECPECEKLVRVRAESEKLGAFLDWMLSTQDLVIAEYQDDSFEGYLLFPSEYRGNSGINKLIALYFDIDLDLVEKERKALLEWVREQHETN